MIKLRPYQEEPIKKAIEFFRLDNPEPALMVWPTAAGKSILSAEVAAACPDPILIVQPTKELLEQNLSKYRQLCGDLAPAGVYSASFGKKEIDHVTFATIGSIKSIGNRFKELGFKKMLIDEAHLYPRKEQSMLGQFLKDSGIRHVLGITATPLKLEQFTEKQGKRFDKWSELLMLTALSPSGRFFKEIINIIQVRQMVEGGYWSPLQYEVLPFSKDTLVLNSTGSEFTDESAVNAYVANNVRKNIFNALDYHAERRHCLVFVPSVEEAAILASEYPESAYVCGETPKKERDRIIEDFREGRIRVLFNVGVLSCLSEDTEILTDNGWENINEIGYHSNVAQYDLSTREITFSKPSNIINKEHTGDMVFSNNKYMSIRVTEDHTVFFHKKTADNKLTDAKPIEAKELVNKKNIYIPVNGHAAPAKIKVTQKKLPTEKRFIATNAYNYRKRGVEYERSIELAKEQYEIKKDLRYKNPDELTLDECRFIGFWLGDGTKYQTKRHDRKNGIRYSLSQSLKYPKMIKWIETNLNKCGISYTTRDVKKSSSIIAGKKAEFSAARYYYLWLGTGGRGQKINSNLHKLIPYLEKDGTQLYWGLNREQYHALMEGFFKANGDHGDNKEYKGRHIISPHKKLLDILQAVGVCRGYRIIISKLPLRKGAKTTLYTISLTDIKYHEFVNDVLKKEKVRNEKVWCVTMPKGTIVTRRNGRVSILGNCGFDYTKIDMIILAFSTASVSKYFQVIGRGVRIDPEKKDCVIVDMGGNVDRFGRTEDAYYKKGVDGQWRLYGTGGIVLTGFPVQILGKVTRQDICRANSTYSSRPDLTTLDFGKYKGRAISDIPVGYLAWNIDARFGSMSVDEYDACIQRLQDHIRDTTNDPPAIFLPDGKHAGERISEIPAGYLRWYIESKEWNETNDSLRRGILTKLGHCQLLPSKKREHAVSPDGLSIQLQADQPK